MKLTRRKFLHLAAGAGALPSMLGTARTETFPSRPVRLIVGFPAGGGPDILARLLAQAMSDRFGQRFVIENRPGAGGNIATDLVAKAPHDGYTLLWTVAANAINATLYPNLNFNYIRDIDPVAAVGRTIFVMVTNPSVPAQTVPEFIAYAKANPGKVNIASAGIGTGDHVFGELFKMMTGVELVHVPYRGSYYPDLLAGQVQVAFPTMTSSIPHIRAGRLRGLAVTTLRRSEALPDIPTVGEFVPGYEASGWQGIGAPKDTPAEIIEKLGKEIIAVAADPQLKTRFADIGVEPMPMTPGDFGTFIAGETEKWAKVIKFAHIKPE